MSDLQVFNNEEFGQVRVLEKDGQPFYFINKFKEMMNSKEAISN